MSAEFDIMLVKCHINIGKCEQLLNANVGKQCYEMSDKMSQIFSEGMIMC